MHHSLTRKGIRLRLKRCVQLHPSKTGGNIISSHVRKSLLTFPGPNQVAYHERPTLDEFVC